MVGANIIITDNSQMLELNDLSFIHADNLKLFHRNDRRIQNICNYLFEKDEANPHTPM